MSDLTWLDWLQEQDELNPFSVDELPRQWREAYTETLDLEEAA